MRISLLSTLALALSAPAFAADPGKADVCHWDDTTGTASVITISTKAVAAHIANHGDSLAAVYFEDADADGFGDAAGATDRCPNAGFVGNNTDCDDTDAAVNPGAAEVPYDGIDNDCAVGTRDDDLDDDGFDQAEDCDDDDAAVNPGAEDVCDDGIDNNCSGVIDEDCADDCPCFTAADIDAAYARHLAFSSEYSDYSYNTTYCQEYDYNDAGWYGYYQNSTEIWFNAFAGDFSTDYYHYYYSGYEGAYSGFYGVTYGYNDYGYETTYCNGYTSEYAWDGVNYTDAYTNNFQYVTDEQAAACEAVVSDWAADNALECYVYTY
ncbi:MAG: putative metal-binding motif-containing protein [Myxococcota bacterium]